MKNIFKKHINNNIENITEKNITEETAIEEHIDKEFKLPAESIMEQFDEAKKDFADKLHVAANTFSRDLRKNGLYFLVGDDMKKLKEAHEELIKVLFEMEDHLAAELNKVEV